MYHKLVKTAIIYYRFAWHKSTDDSFKMQPKKFWKYVSAFQKSNSTLTQLHVGGSCIDDPGDIDVAFSKHFIQPTFTFHHHLVPFQFFVLIFYH